MLVPAVSHSLTLKTTAKHVLIVEDDATFQRRGRAEKFLHPYFPAVANDQFHLKNACLIITVSQVPRNRIVDCWEKGRRDSRRIDAVVYQAIASRNAPSCLCTC